MISFLRQWDEVMSKSNQQRGTDDRGAETIAGGTVEDLPREVGVRSPAAWQYEMALGCFRRQSVTRHAAAIRFIGIAEIW